MQSLFQSLKRGYLELDSPLSRKDYAIGVGSLVGLMLALLLLALLITFLSQSSSAGILLGLLLIVAIPAILLALCAVPAYLLIWGFRRGLCSQNPSQGRWVGLSLGVLSITVLPLVGCVALLLWPTPKPPTLPLSSLREQ